MVTQEQLKRAKLKIKAKAFRDSIPIGFAYPIPEELFDSLTDNELEEFFKVLYSVGLQKQSNNGLWERR